MKNSLKEKAKASLTGFQDKISSFKEDFWDEDKKEIIKQFKENGEAKTGELIEGINNYKDLYA